MEYNVNKRTEQKVIDKMAGIYFTGMLLKLETEQFGYMGMVILDCLSKGLDLGRRTRRPPSNTTASASSRSVRRVSSTSVSPRSRS